MQRVSMMVLVAIMSSGVVSPAAPPVEDDVMPTPVKPVARPTSTAKVVKRAFKVARGCTAIRSVKSAQTKLLDAKQAAPAHEPVRVGPPSTAYSYLADGRVLYVDPADNRYKVVAATGGTASKGTPDPDPRADAVTATFAPMLALPNRVAPGFIVPLSASYAVEVANPGAQPGGLVALDAAQHQVQQVMSGAPVGLPERIDDTRVAFIAKDGHVDVADVAARDVRCASIKVGTGRRIDPQVAGTDDGKWLAYTTFVTAKAGQDGRGFEVHVVDLARGRDAIVATANAYQVVVAAVPGKPAFVVQTQYYDPSKAQPGGDRQYEMETRFHLLDASKRTATPLTAVVPGWSNLWVAPDGSSLLFGRGRQAVSDPRPPKPPHQDPVHLPGHPATCDRIGCRTGCGWQSDGCGDYEWCGDCPGQPRPVEPGPDDGIYTLAL